MPQKTTLKQQTVHKHIGTKAKIDTKSLKTRMEWSYRILKISKTTQLWHCSSAATIEGVASNQVNTVYENV